MHHGWSDISSPCSACTGSTGKWMKDPTMRHHGLFSTQPMPALVGSHASAVLFCFRENHLISGRYLYTTHLHKNIRTQDCEGRRGALATETPARAQKRRRKTERHAARTPTHLGARRRPRMQGDGARATQRRHHHGAYEKEHHQSACFAISIQVCSQHHHSHKAIAHTSGPVPLVPAHAHITVTQVTLCATASTLIDHYP